MHFGEGVGAGGGGHRVHAGSGESSSDQPPGGMRFQVPGSGSYAGKRFRFCVIKILEILFKFTCIIEIKLCTIKAFN